ncbi:hypothetical protein [Paenibacillus sp. y28]|uniref:hypothetical protein n=1 Tax=Paenibacillus sp. y28 TaxID=3129110 RepID=UPI0030173DC2
MSRKWERMVQKNTKQVNKVRGKSGQQAIQSGKAADGGIIHRGRSILYSVLLWGVSLFMFVAYVGTELQDGWYWFTVIAYFLLGLFIFFLKRPYLKIGKAFLATRRWNREKRIEASEVAKIVLAPSYVQIEPAGKGQRWVFSKPFNLFPVQRMTEDLREFAERNHIEVSEVTK